MRNNRSFAWIAIIALTLTGLAITPPAEAQRRSAMQVGPNCVGGIGALFDEIEFVALTDDEAAALAYLREEEKLARDVYLTLAEIWQLPIFANIAVAEQNHMDIVFKALQISGVEDPVTDDTIGVFNNGGLTQMYVDFVADGGLSLIDALSVGAEIEDMDLADLYMMIENYPHDLVQLVAFNLAKGSRNHLRAFVRALAAQGVTYTPNYLDQEAFDAILAAEMEQRMFFDADGEPVAACGGAIDGFGMRRGHGGNGGQDNGSGTGQGECDGTGNASGECDGTGPHGGSNGGNGSGAGGGD